MYVILVRWVVKDGMEEQVVSLLEKMIAHTRQEPGCDLYVAGQSAENPREIRLFERYADEAAFQAHISAPYFEAIVRNQISPMLESRERQVLRSIEARS